VEAVAREFLGRNVVPKVAGLCALDQQAPDEAGEVLQTTLPTRWWSPQRSLEADLNRARGQGFFDREPP